MADSKITALTAITTPDDADLATVVDVSDTTMAATGTNKKLTWSNIKATLKTYFDTLYTKCTGAEITTGTDDTKFVTPKALADATGSKLGGAWTSWTPTWTNVTIGNATVEAKYNQIGKTVHCRMAIKWGNTTSASGIMFFTLPVTSVTYSGTAQTQTLGTIWMVDAGTTSYKGLVSWATTTTARVNVEKSDGTYTTIASVNATIPMTWTTDDEILAEFFYEAS